VGDIMKWQLYRKLLKGWDLVFECNSGDACKTFAKNRNRSEYRMNLGLLFLIKDPVGNNWKKSVNTESWRMKWVDAESGDDL
jgi:hypothetical protein